MVAMTEDSTWAQRRRRAEIFGDDLPTVTSDEASLTKSDKDHGGEGSDADEWLLSNKPPHHE